MTLDTDSQDCKILQSEEFEVLQSIYPDCVLADTLPNKSDAYHILQLDVPIDFDQPTKVEVVPTAVNSESDNSGQDRVEVTVTGLPSILLAITLPPTYPLREPPKIESVHVSHSWLPSTIDLRQELLQIWQGDGVLYSWVEWIRSAEFLDAVGLRPAASGPISIPHPAPHILAPFLQGYDETLRRKLFAQTAYTCSICFETFKGTKCLQLSCKHVFCRNCLIDFWGLCIREGDISRMGCPDPTCVKSHREANEEEVVRVLSSNEVKRWRWLREKRAIERDPSIMHCPLETCQAPVPKPMVEDEESGWARLRTCPSCRYSFCSFCKRTWHGPISHCPISVTEKLVLEYLELPERSPRRLVLEKQYGKNNLGRLVSKYEEERANREYLESQTTKCPTCEVFVQKSLGCNHMTCAKCGSHFCYRCASSLRPSNPYAHFSTPGLQCYNKLFDFESVDQEWQPVEGLEFL